MVFHVTHHDGVAPFVGVAALWRIVTGMVLWLLGLFLGMSYVKNSYHRGERMLLTRLHVPVHICVGSFNWIPIVRKPLQHLHPTKDARLTLVGRSKQKLTIQKMI